MRSFKKSILFLFIFFSVYEFSITAEERKHSRFIVITPQKTGTHLLLPIIKNMLGKKWKFIPGENFNPKRLERLLTEAEDENIFLQIHSEPKKHVINTLKRNKYKVIYMWRDPRDQVLSMLFRVIWGRIYGPLNMTSAFGQLSFDEQLHEVITGERFGFSVTRDMMVNRIPWLHQDSNFVYVVHFENLIGQEGGGSRSLQLKEISNIAKHLNVKLNEEEIGNCTEGVFGESCNFRSGQIGEWKIHFTEEHKQLFKDLFGDALIKTGYEKDYNW
jgi:sulfotransferase 6B1